MDCQICFCPLSADPLIGNLDRTVLCCSLTSCTKSICFDCTERLLDFCEKENILPSCPSCTTEFLLDDFPNGKLQILYIEKTAHRIVKGKISEQNTSQSQRSLIDRIRQEKQSFVEKTFPPAITRIIHLSMKAELVKITKSNRQRLLNLQASTKACLLVTCPGKLDLTTFQCNVCNVRVCPRCEQILGDGHLCQEAELASIKYISTLVKCPKCQIPAVKSFGCDNMTCSSCKTNYHYTTGVRVAAGNHSNDTITLQQETLPSRLLKDHYDESIIQKIEEIERTKPPMAVDKLSMVKNLQDLSPIQVCKMHQRFCNQQRNNRLYYEKLNRIMQMHDENKLEM